jgi:hypothetical protein
VYSWGRDCIFSQYTGTAPIFSMSVPVTIRTIKSAIIILDAPETDFAGYPAGSLTQHSNV